MLDFLPFCGFLECQKDVEETRILGVESLGEDLSNGKMEDEIKIGAHLVRLHNFKILL